MNLNCRGDLYEKFNSLSAKAQVDYYLKDFAFSLYGKSKEKQMSIDLVKTTMPARYGLSISYHHKICMPKSERKVHLQVKTNRYMK